MNSASLCSLAGRYDNPIPPGFLAPIDFLKIPALIASKLIKEERNIFIEKVSLVSMYYLFNEVRI
jgi:hypothetical protein